MRRRLIITYVTLLAAVLAGLNVPLAITIAGYQGQRLFVDRQADTARFASLAEPALRTGETAALSVELQRYDELFGIAAAVVARDGGLVLASRAGLDPAGELLREHVDAALSGQRADLAHTSWPWAPAPMVVAEPVGQGGEVIGAVLTVSPTDALRTATWWSWALLAAVSAAALVAGVAAAGPLANWMLRPVQQLDQAAHALAAGRWSDRVLEQTGPPELRRLTASFHRMADQVATLVERQRSFVSYASHQLRTPLATLQLWVDNLAPSVSAAGAQDYRMVAAEIERMGAMCDALLTYARAEAIADEVSDVDAAEVADARVAVWAQAAGQAGVRLERTGAAGAPVRAAPQALDQALDALLSNAVKYAGRGARVVVRVDGHADRVEIHVIDDGPGITAAELAFLTEPFWRSTSHQHLDGSGLGMAVADALVSASGGGLELRQADPHGLHARIWLRPAGLA